MASLRPLMERRAQLLSGDITKQEPKYKMGWGQRLLGTASNFLTGFGGGHQPPTYVGPGATNRRYEQDVAQNQAQIGDQEKLAGMNQKLYEDAIKQAYESQLGESRIKLGEAAEGKAQSALELAGVKQQLAGSQEELNRGRAQQATSTANQKDATRPTKVMGDRTFEKQDDGKWKDIGPAPTKQFNPNTGRGRGSAADFDKIAKDKKKALDDAEAKAAKAIAGIKPPLVYPPSAEHFEYSKNPVAWKEAKKQEIYDQLEKDKAQAQASYEERIQGKGGSISSPAGQQTVRMPPATNVIPNKAGAPKPGTTPAAAPKGKPVQTFKGRNVNDVVKLKNGQSVRITQLYDDGHFDHQPAN